MPIQPSLSAIDHLVLTVSDFERTTTFYRDVLGMSLTSFRGADGRERFALQFGRQKINLHIQGAEIAPHAAHPLPGSLDICLISDAPLEDWIDHLAKNGVTPESSIVERTGATGRLRSIYLRDPDLNLIEISNHL